jgi:hypothetical protein
MGKANSSFLLGNPECSLTYYSNTIITTLNLQHITLKVKKNCIFQTKQE